MSNFFSVTREKNFSFDFSSRPKTIIHHRMVDCWVLWSLQRVQSAKQSEIVWGAWTHCRFDGLSLWEFWSKREQTIVKLIATMQVPSQDPHFDSIIWILRFSNTSTQFFRHGWSRNLLSIFDLGTILIHPSSLAYLPKHTITPFFWGRGNQVERTWTNLLFSKIYRTTNWPLWDVQPQWRCRSHVSKEYSSLESGFAAPKKIGRAQFITERKEMNLSIGMHGIYRILFRSRSTISTREACFFFRSSIFEAAVKRPWFLNLIFASPRYSTIQIWVNSHSSPIWIEMKVLPFLLKTTC